MPSAADDRLLDRRGDEALHQVRRGARIGGGDRTTVLDSFGYCRIGRLVAAEADQQDQQADHQRQHGALMKISVMAMTALRDQWLARRDLRARWLSIQRRLGRDLRRGIGRDRDRRPGLQLKLANRHHPVAGLYAAQDHRAAVILIAGAHEGSHRGEAGRAILAFFSVIRKTESP